MKTWQVSLDYTANLGDSEETLDRLCDLSEDLAQFGAAVGLTDGALSLTLSMQGDHPVSVLADADSIVRQSAKKCGLPELDDLGEAHANAWERAEAELDKPTLPDLVSSVEAAEILGVSRQRVSELRRRKDFPEPVYELRTGPLWIRAGIERFNERWDRKPGRPRSIPWEKLKAEIGL
jgi:hypothetical protein